MWNSKCRRSILTSEIYQINNMRFVAFSWHLHVSQLNSKFNGSFALFLNRINAAMVLAMAHNSTV